MIEMSPIVAGMGNVVEMSGVSYRRAFVAMRTLAALLDRVPEQIPPAQCREAIEEMKILRRLKFEFPGQNADAVVDRLEELVALLTEIESTSRAFADAADAFRRFAELGEECLP